MDKKLISEIYSISGVNNFLTHERSDNEALPFHSLEIAINRVRDLKNKNFRLKKAKDYFIGENIEVNNGTFKGISGIISKVSSDGKDIYLSLKINLFNEDSILKISKDYVKKINK